MVSIERVAAWEEVKQMQLQQPQVPSNANKNLLTVKAAYCSPCKAALEAVQGHKQQLSSGSLWILMCHVTSLFEHFIMIRESASLSLLDGSDELQKTR